MTSDIDVAIFHPIVRVFLQSQKRSDSAWNGSKAVCSKIRVAAVVLHSKYLDHTFVQNLEQNVKWKPMKV